jgi:hypothetical protein
MNQELTVSSGLPVYLYQEHLSNLFNRNRELIDSISLNYLCFDEQKEYFIHLMESFDQIEASAPIKRQLEIYLFDLFSKKGRPKQLKGEYSEINICKASKDRIYLAPEKEESELAVIAQQNPKLKVCSAVNIFEVLPPLPNDVELVKGGQYNLAQLFAPYAKGSKTLGLIDPYIYNQFALVNFKTLATKTVYEKITIKCNPPEQLKGKEGKPVSTVQFDSLMKELRDKGTEVEILYYDRIRHKERFVLYDDVQIYIPGGLDMFDPSGTFLNDGEGFYLTFNKRKIRLNR